MCSPQVATIVASIALSACSAATAPVGPTGDIRVSNAPSLLVMTDNGVGPITYGTPFDKDAMSQVVAGAELRTVDAARESGSTRTPAAFVNGQQAVQFFKGDGDTVGEVHGIGTRTAGPNGERIGMTVAEAGLRRGDCRVGRAEWRGMAVCKARRSQHIDLIFSIPQYDGPWDALPDDQQLATAELQRIVWHARA